MSSVFGPRVVIVATRLSSGFRQHPRNIVGFLDVKGESSVSPVTVAEAVSSYYSGKTGNKAETRTDPHKDSCTLLLDVYRS